LPVGSQRTEELLGQLVVEVCDRPGRQIGLEGAEASPRDVDRARGACLVHRHRGLSEAGDSRAIPECLVERLAEADAYILNRVVGSGVQVATRVDVELQATVAGHEIEHVVEETNSRFALTLTKTVEAELDRDGGLSRGALDLGSASHCRPLSRM